MQQILDFHELHREGQNSIYAAVIANDDQNIVVRIFSVEGRPPRHVSDDRKIRCCTFSLGTDSWTSKDTSMIEGGSTVETIVDAYLLSDGGRSSFFTEETNYPFVMSLYEELVSISLNKEELQTNKA